VLSWISSVKVRFWTFDWEFFDEDSVKSSAACVLSIEGSMFPCVSNSSGWKWGDGPWNQLPYMFLNPHDMVNHENNSLVII
jgi:hypothetical protein